MKFSLKCFLLAALSFCSLPAFAADERPVIKPEIFKPREGFKNVLRKLDKGEDVCIGYFGGSITEWTGWREMTYQWFQETWPKAKLSQVNASMGGTGSTLGIYRADGQLLAKNPDLVFVEFGVNDRETEPASLDRAMEGIVRKIWKHNPQTDICFVYTLNLEAVPDYEANQCPRSVTVHEQVAEHYGIPSINVAFRMVQLQQAGKAIYNPEKDAEGKELPAPAGKIIFGKDTCHPGVDGHRVYAEVVQECLKKPEATAKEAGAHKIPAPRVADNWENARIVPPTELTLSKNWRRMDDKAGPGVWLRKYVPDVYETDTPGETMTFKFKGKSAQLYYIAGPDSCVALYSVDGKPEQKHNLFGAYSTGHGAAVLWLGGDLAEGEHTLTVKLSPERPDKSVMINQEKDKPNFDPKKYEANFLRIGGVLLLGEAVK